MSRLPVRILFTLALPLMLSVERSTSNQFHSSSRQERQGGQSKQNLQDESPESSPIAKIEFEGNRLFTSQELAEILKRCLNKDDAAQLKYEERFFEYCTQYTVVNFIRSRGYLQARIGEPKKRETKSGMNITLPVEEGTRYRYGEIKVDGLSLFSLDQFKEMVRFEPGGVANGQELLEGLQGRLKRAYAERGHLQYDYDVEPIFGSVTNDAGDATVDLVITISEGPMFKVRRIEFKGNTTARDDVLRREVSLKEDETFNPTFLEESIERLNGLGLFEHIDWQRDVSFRTDDERGLLDLTINVKEKEPQ